MTEPITRKQHRKYFTADELRWLITLCGEAIAERDSHVRNHYDHWEERAAAKTAYCKLYNLANPQ